MTTDISVGVKSPDRFINGLAIINKLPSESNIGLDDSVNSELSDTFSSVQKILDGGYLEEKYNFIEKRGDDFFILKDLINENEDINNILISFFDDMFGSGLFLDGFHKLDLNGFKIYNSLFKTKIKKLDSDLKIGRFKQIINSYFDCSIRHDNKDVGLLELKKFNKYLNIDEILAFLWKGGNSKTNHIKTGFNINAIILTLAYIDGKINEDSLKTRLLELFTKGGKISEKDALNKVSNLVKINGNNIFLTVAEEIMPVQGNDSHIEILSSKLKESFKPSDSSLHGKKNMFLYENTTFNIGKGEELLKKIPIIKPINGYKLNGDKSISSESPNDDIDFNILAGDNIEIIKNPDGSEILISKIDGYIDGFDANNLTSKINITKEKAFTKDINSKTGDIELTNNEKQLIDSNITEGRKVFYTGPSLEITGNVSKGKIILNNDKSDLTIGGDVINSEIIILSEGKVTLNKIGFGTIIYAPNSIINIEEASGNVIIIGKEVKINFVKNVDTILGNHINIGDLDSGNNTFLVGSTINVTNVSGKKDGNIRVLLEDSGNKSQIVKKNSEINKLENTILQFSKKINFAYKGRDTNPSWQKLNNLLLKLSTDASDRIKLIKALETKVVKKTITDKEKLILGKIKDTQIYTIYNTITLLEKSLFSINAQIDEYKAVIDGYKINLEALINEKKLLETKVQKNISFNLEGSSTKEYVKKFIDIFNGSLLYDKKINTSFYKDQTASGIKIDPLSIILSDLFAIIKKAGKHNSDDFTQLATSIEESFYYEHKAINITD